MRLSTSTVTIILLCIILSLESYKLPSTKKYCKITVLATESPSNINENKFRIPTSIFEQAKLKSDMSKLKDLNTLAAKYEAENKKVFEDTVTFPSKFLIKVVEIIK